MVQYTLLAPKLIENIKNKSNEIVGLHVKHKSLYLTRCLALLSQYGRAFCSWRFDSDRLSQAMLPGHC